MYKRFTFEEVKTIKSNFVANLYGIMKRERCLSFKDLLVKSFQHGDSVYYFFRGNPQFRLIQDEENLTLIDEKEKIELVLSHDKKNQVQSLLKKYMIKGIKKDKKKSVIQILGDSLLEGDFSKIDGKSYLIYDIETDSNVANLKETEFFMAYSMEIDEENNTKYQYISKERLPDFVEYMLNFDGYIIGFNSIAFDNPVCVHNINGTQEQIDQLNKKSIDIFLFIWSLTKRRIGLNKVAQAFVGIEKTLDVGANGETLWNLYKEKGDEKALNEFKRYCKNDVKMTAMVLFYLLYYKKVFRESEAIGYEIEDLYKLTQTRSTKKVKKEQSFSNQSIFS